MGDDATENEAPFWMATEWVLMQPWPVEERCEYLERLGKVTARGRR